MKSKLQISFELSASVSKVWNALTDSNKTKYYMFGTRAMTDWKPGSELLWVGEQDGKEIIYVQGHITKVEIGTYLEYTIIAPNMDIRPNNHLYVGFSLKEVGEKTQVIITQWDFETVDDGEQRYNDAKEGWTIFEEGFRKLIED